MPEEPTHTGPRPPTGHGRQAESIAETYREHGAAPDEAARNAAAIVAKVHRPADSRAPASTADSPPPSSPPAAPSRALEPGAEP